MATKSPLERIQEIKEAAEAEIAKLQSEALGQLKEELKTARAEVSRIEAQIAELGGKAPKSGGRGSSSSVASRTVTNAELKKALKDDKTAKDGESNSRTLAKALNALNTDVISTARADAAFKVRAKAPHYFISLK